MLSRTPPRENTHPETPPFNSFAPIPGISGHTRPKNEQTGDRFGKIIHSSSVKKYYIAQTNQTQ